MVYLIFTNIYISCRRVWLWGWGLGWGWGCIELSLGNLPARIVIAAGISLGDFTAATLFSCDGLVRAAAILGVEETMLIGWFGVI